MSVCFVHLSDIHFGQETGGQLTINNDIKERLIDDVASVTKELTAGRTQGLIVTGDIAFSGKEVEYRLAGSWLDRVTQAAGCEPCDIQVVPGNHDIDRNEITPLTEMMLMKIAEEGEPALDRFLEKEADREVLFRRFSAYRPFAEGYRCPLDVSGQLAEEHLVPLAPGRAVRFIRLNSALACSKNDKRGRLLLGAGQRVLNQRRGEELIVLCHHPLHWCQDSDDALLFIKNRARVFICGHEHKPAFSIEKVDETKDLMMLAAGATVPPNSDKKHGYRYNFLEFEWDEPTDALKVVVRPRKWLNGEKCFSADKGLPGGNEAKFTLRCPNFRQSPLEFTFPVEEGSTVGAADTIQIASPNNLSTKAQEEPMADSYSLLLLHFFRDVSQAQRVNILAKLGALPLDWKGNLSETTQRRAFDRLVKEGRSEDLWTEVHKRTSSQQKEG